MKKILYIALFLTFAIAQTLAEEIKVLPDSLLMECYGGIRADMARTACEIAGFKNDSIIKLITNHSLGYFLKALKDNDDVLHEVINGSNRYLEKMSIREYDSVLNVIRRNLCSRMLVSYPDEEDNINNKFSHYFKNKIGDLSSECICFEKSTDDYKKTFSKGRFISLIATKKTGPSSSLTTPQKSSDKSDNKTNEDMRQTDGFSIISLINGIIYAVGILAILVIGYKFSRPLIKKYLKRMEQKENNETDIEPKDNGLPSENESVTLNESSHNPEIKDDSNENNPEPSIEGGTIARVDRPVEEEKKEEEQGKEEPGEEKKEGQAKEPSSTVKFSYNEDGWLVVGASVQGNGHISENIPCQDNCAYEYLGNGWGIAITSDGAGSAVHSHLGSKATVYRAMHYMKTIVEQEGWINKNQLPTDVRWLKLSRQVLKAVRDDIFKLATAKNIEPKSLSATVIVIIHSPLGLLTTHIGDGRAGYRDAEGNWKALITPHKGEEANQTIFVPSNFWDIPIYEMSGVMVPESRIVKDKITAFTLMSDGCERTTWLFNQKDEQSGMFYDPNLPYPKFFDPIIDSLLATSKNEPIDEIAKKWYSFIKDGNEKFQTETDDKTMILGILES